MYPGESLADVKECWSGDRVSEVGGGEQQGRHLQIDQLQTQKHTAEFVSFVTPKRAKSRCLRKCRRVHEKIEVMK